MSEKELQEKIQDLLSQKVKDKTLTPDTNLLDLGLDSLDKADIMISLEDEFNISFNEDEMLNVSTIGDLEKLIQEKIK